MKNIFIALVMIAILFTGIVSAKQNFILTGGLNYTSWQIRYIRPSFEVQLRQDYTVYCIGPSISRPIKIYKSICWYGGVAGYLCSPYDIFSVTYTGIEITLPKNFSVNAEYQFNNSTLISPYTSTGIYCNYYFSL